jgi:nitrous oxide reductase
MAHWLRHYTLALVAGVFIILAVGIFANTRSDTSATGYATYDGSDAPKGQTIEQRVIVKDCRFTPETIIVGQGDLVQLKFVVYDPSGRSHNIVLKDYGIDVKVKGTNIGLASFTAEKKGVFIMEDVYPCKALGKKSQTKLLVR